MAFTGNLNAMALPDILQLIALAQKSGTLTVVTGRGRFTILFRSGTVIDALAVRFPQRGGRGAGQRKEVQIRANLTGDPSRDMGLEEMVSKIIRLNAGYFNFAAGEPSTDSAVALDVSTLRLESFRQQDQALRDGTQLPND